MTEPIDPFGTAPSGSPTSPATQGAAAAPVAAPAPAASVHAAAGDPATVPATDLVRAGRNGRGVLDVVLALAAAVAIAGLAFAVGRTTAPPAVSTAFTRGGFAAGGGGAGTGAAPGFASGGAGRAGRGGVFAIEGSVVAVTSDHLTLTLASGQTVQIPLSNTTAYHRSSPATSADVVTGSHVLVQFAPRVPGSPNQSSGGGAGGQALPGQSPVASGQGGAGTPRFLSGAATDVTVVGQ